MSTGTQPTHSAETKWRDTYSLRTLLSHLYNKVCGACELFRISQRENGIRYRFSCQNNDIFLSRMFSGAKQHGMTWIVVNYTELCVNGKQAV